MTAPVCRHQAARHSQRASRGRAAWLLLLAVLLGGQHPASGGSRFNRVLDIGATAPSWEGLPGQDGKPHSLADHAAQSVVVVIFTSQECPIAAAYRQRIEQLANDFQPSDVAIILIYANRDEELLRLSPTEPAEPAQEARGIVVEHLRDGTQQVARAFGATCTPHAFVLDRDRQIAYMGAIDDHWQNADNVKHFYVRDAIEALLRGNPVPHSEARPIGCAIHWSNEVIGR